MTSVFMHHNETIFPDSYEFIPERWMDLEQRKHLEKYMVAFTKGSRQCIGMKCVSFFFFSSLFLFLFAPFVSKKITDTCVPYQSRAVRNAASHIKGIP